MMTVRAAVVFLVFASTFLAVAEAKKKGTPLTNKLFSSTETFFVHHPNVVKAWKASYAKKAKTTSSRAARAGVKRAADTTDTCIFVDNGMLGLGAPPLGLTVCQPGTCSCPTNEFCASYANPTVDLMGICVCGASICDRVSGLSCVATTLASGKQSFQCAHSDTEPTPPYILTKLMR